MEEIQAVVSLASLALHSGIILKLVERVDGIMKESPIDVPAKLTFRKHFCWNWQYICIIKFPR